MGGLKPLDIGTRIKICQLLNYVQNKRDLNIVHK